MAVAGQYLEVFSEIALDGGRLGRRFYDQQLYDTLLFSIRGLAAKGCSISCRASCRTHGNRALQCFLSVKIGDQPDKTETRFLIKSGFPY
jgi:hypothetical protein